MVILPVVASGQSGVTPTLPVCLMNTHLMYKHLFQSETPVAQAGWLSGMDVLGLFSTAVPCLATVTEATTLWVKPNQIRPHEPSLTISINLLYGFYSLIGSSLLHTFRCSRALT